MAMRRLIVFLLVLVALAAAGGYAAKRAISDLDSERVIAGVFKWLWEEATEESVEDGERKVALALERYAEAQARHHAGAGRYAKALAHLEGLPEGMSAADFGSAEQDFHGYLFIAVEMNGATPMDYRNGFVLVAFPAFYPASGSRSFAIGPTGVVIAKEGHGTPVMNATELASWRPL